MNLFLKSAAELCRAAIALLTAYSALTGHLLGPHPSLPAVVLLTAAVFILAAGASALNQYQEREFDARMERTRHRPLPNGLITPIQALSIALMLISTGLAMLLAGGQTKPFLLGIVALALYNGMYTQLKRVTAFAAIPGAMVGMIPPAMGWSSAGGDIPDPRLFALCFLFFIWQVPHFWLQILRYGKEYEQAGLPSLSSLLNKKQITRMIFVWICAAAVSGLLLPFYGVIRNPILYFLLFPCAGIIIMKGFTLLGKSSSARTASAFRTFNAYMIFVLSLLTIEGLFLRMP